MTAPASPAAPPLVIPPDWVSVHAVTCCRGHPIARQAIPTPAGFAQCKHFERGYQCTEWVWMLACNAAAIVYVGRVSDAQRRHILAADLAPLDVLAYLGWRPRLP